MTKRGIRRAVNVTAGLALGVFIIALGHFGNWFGIALTIGSFVVFIGCLILAHLLDDGDEGYWPNNPHPCSSVGDKSR